MATIRGLYNGQTVILLEPVSLPPNTEVEIVIPESEEAGEDQYWQQLQALGLIEKRRVVSQPHAPFTPIKITGKPLSQTIVEERGE